MKDDEKKRTSPATEPSVSYFFEQLKAGDQSAARELWQHFFPRLLALSEKTLTGRPKRVADAEDAVQSAFASFCRGVERGQFNRAENREDLWKLLATITVRKAKKHVQRESALKRGGGKVRTETELANVNGEPARLEDLVTQMPASTFDQYCNETIELLDEDLQRFVWLRLMGYQNREVAEELQCSESTVERKLRLVRTIWNDQLGE